MASESTVSANPSTEIRFLAVSDEVDQRIYTTSVKERMADVNIVIGCGDVPATYLEFLVDVLNKPVYYVLGNHAEEITRAGERGVLRLPEGCTNVGGKVIHDPQTGLIIAGLPGSPRYSEHEPVQFTEWQMKWIIFRMLPRLFLNRLRFGRYLDILVTHSPPRHVNDREDLAHRGFMCMRTFLKWFKPRYQLHGHIHLYDRSLSNEVTFSKTRVINIYPYHKLELSFSHLPRQAAAPDLQSPTTHAAAPRLDAEHRP